MCLRDCLQRTRALRGPARRNEVGVRLIGEQALQQRQPDTATSALYKGGGTGCRVWTFNWLVCCHKGYT